MGWVRNIMDYGNSIQDAIDSLPSAGGEVYIPAGSYVLTDRVSISGSDNILLRGAGMGATFITCGTNMNKSELLLIGSSKNSTIRDLTLDGNGYNQVDYTDGFTVANQSRNCVIDNIRVQNCYTNAGAMKGKYQRISNCRFDNCNISMGSLGFANDNFGIWGQNIVVTNCVSTNTNGTMTNGFGVYAPLTSTPNSTCNISISNCTTENCNGGFNVEAVGSGVVIDNCTSLNDDTPFTCNRTAGSPHSVLFNNCYASNWNSTHAVWADYGGITISNCTFVADGITTNGIDFGWTSYMGSNMIVTGNRIVTNGHGIIIGGSTLDVIINGNYFNVGSNAIESKSDFMTISNNIIDRANNGITSRDGASNWIISNNRIRNTTGRGIYLWDIINGSHNDWLIEGNEIGSCTDHGIQVNGVLGFKFHNNIIKNNVKNGIHMWGDNFRTSIIGNTCSNNGSYGIQLIDNSDYNLITNNICIDNAVGQTGSTGVNDISVNNMVA